MYCYNCMNVIKEGTFCTSCMTENIDKSSAHHLKPGTVLNKKYIVGNVIGEGGFGITYVGLDTTLDIRIAIKEYYPNGHVNRNNETTNDLTVTEKSSAFFGKGKENFLIEARNIAKFSQEKGIVDVRDYFEENATAYIIMDFLDGHTLADHLKNYGIMDTKQLFTLMRPIMVSLKKIHHTGIVHRDISPDNIMYLTDGTLKLMDFGAARYFLNEENKMSVMLKKGYAPEEQHRKNGAQGPWTDVYGMCATIYKCITGKIPDDALDRLYEDTLQKPSELGIDITKQFEAIIMYGLAIHKENRCRDMSELIELTDKALNVRSSVSSVPYNKYRTQQADEDYRTQAADESYRTQAADEEELLQFSNRERSSYSSTPKDEKPATGVSSYKGLKIALNVLIALCIFAIVGVVVLFANIKDNDDASADTPVASTEKQEATDETAVSTTEEETTLEPTPEPVIEDATYFSGATASSIFPDQQQYNYSPTNVLTQDTTCWCEGAEGFGIGEWIKLDLPAVQRVNGLKIINGYAGTEKQYNDNCKISEILIEFSDGRSVRTTLTVFHELDRNTIQYIEFNQPVETSYVKITIQNIVEGTCEDTCLTYVAPY